jgi:hypothetical protein
MPQFTMKQLSSSTKHHILLEYSPYSHTHSFSALAAKHGIAGGKSTIIRWYKQWDRTPQSLEHHKGAGRPRLLTRAQVTRHVRVPILAANRAHRPVHYTSLLANLKQKTRKNVSIQTFVVMANNSCM